MKSKVIFASAMLLLSTSFILGQSSDSIILRSNTFNSYEVLRANQEKPGIDSLIYLDSTFNYKVHIPGWLHLIKTNSESLFGGTLPPLNGIENAILVKGFSKSDFKSFDEFKEIYLTGNKFGHPAKFNKEFIWYGQNELIRMDNGVKEKVFTLWNNKIYYNLFILLETKSAYLWIQFSSTPQTYDVNISKLDEFMLGFKILKYQGISDIY